jgi:hypothetical protein
MGYFQDLKKLKPSAGKASDAQLDLTIDCIEPVLPCNSCAISEKPCIIL